MISNSTFAIGIPTINRADLLNPTLEKYVDDFPNTRIYIVDNGLQNLFTHPNIAVIRPDGNIGVAGSWNLLCQCIFQGRIPDGYAAYAQVLGTDTVSRLYGSFPCSWAWILNDDIYSGKHEEALLHALSPEVLRIGRVADFIAPIGNWSNFLIRPACYARVGPFDHEFYPAYFEDNDYRYRMKLRDQLYKETDLLAPEVLRVSCSIEKDPSLNARFQENLDRYKAKWGGIPGEETFREPWDGKKPRKKG